MNQPRSGRASSNVAVVAKSLEEYQTRNRQSVTSPRSHGESQSRELPVLESLWREPQRQGAEASDGAEGRVIKPSKKVGTNIPSESFSSQASTFVDVRPMFGTKTPQESVRVCDEKGSWCTDAASTFGAVVQAPHDLRQLNFASKVLGVIPNPKARSSASDASRDTKSSPSRTSCDAERCDQVFVEIH